MNWRQSTVQRIEDAAILLLSWVVVGCILVAAWGLYEQARWVEVASAVVLTGVWIGFSIEVTRYVWQCYRCGWY